MLNSLIHPLVVGDGTWRVDHTSSIAITTSTVSKLSRPKSFEKCDVFDTSLPGQYLMRADRKAGDSFYLCRIGHLKYIHVSAMGL